MHKNSLLLGFIISNSTGKGEIHSGFGEQSFSRNLTEVLITGGFDSELSSFLIMEFKAGLGLGSGGASFKQPGNDIIFNKSYLAVRFQTGLNIIFEPVIISLSPGYRIANLGRIKGSGTINGHHYRDIELQYNGNFVEHNYSGFIFTLGVKLLLL